MIDKLSELRYAIEEIPASEQQTKVSVMASDLHNELETFKEIVNGRLERADELARSVEVYFKQSQFDSMDICEVNDIQMNDALKEYMGYINPTPVYEPNYKTKDRKILAFHYTEKEHNDNSLIPGWAKDFCNQHPDYETRLWILQGSENNIYCMSEKDFAFEYQPIESKGGDLCETSG